MTSKKTGQVA